MDGEPLPFDKQQIIGSIHPEHQKFHDCYNSQLQGKVNFLKVCDVLSSKNCEGEVKWESYIIFVTEESEKKENITLSEKL